MNDFENKISELVSNGYRVVDRMACGAVLTAVLDHPSGNFVTVNIKDGYVYVTHKSPSDELDPNDDLMDQLAKEVFTGK